VHEPAITFRNHHRGKILKHGRLGQEPMSCTDLGRNFWDVVVVVVVVVCCSSVEMAAAGDVGARAEPASVTEQEGAAVCATVVQSVGRRHRDDRPGQQARAGSAVVAAAGASARLAASSQSSSRSHLGRMAKKSHEIHDSEEEMMTAGRVIGYQEGYGEGSWVAMIT
jgi:hypothetical protein